MKQRQRVEHEWDLVHEWGKKGAGDRQADWRSVCCKRALYQSVVVKRELSQKARLSIHRSIYVPTLIYGHELWVMTERTRSWIQAAEMGFLQRVSGLALRDRSHNRFYCRMNNIKIRVQQRVIQEGIRNQVVYEGTSLDPTNKPRADAPSGSSLGSVNDVWSRRMFTHSSQLLLASSPGFSLDLWDCVYFWIYFIKTPFLIKSRACCIFLTTDHHHLMTEGPDQAKVRKQL
ncbi:hypothetical protein CCH79_00018322 [Gambusia affinis]|uniref:Uncharacterized protein n=1 Tax=Gambusia affinis TaxID=33528 RepID=A0A315W631_GAMAF|nr:hypothetical protein CCH79_00018322 [Gambusia affinis]